MKKADLSKAKSRAQDTTAAENILQNQQREEYIALNQITDRPTGDTRSLNPTHVQHLTDSIGAIGLISPLTVDQRYQLLAGGHRKAALSKLATEHPARFKELFPTGIPVRIMAVDAEVDTIDALQIEVEENTQRRNYTAAEIREAARKLEAAGYERLRGRPSQGQKSLNRELVAVFRLSRERISRILNEPDKKSVNKVTLSDNTQVFLRQVQKFQQQLDQEEPTPETSKVQRNLRSLIRNLQTLL